MESAQDKIEELTQLENMFPERDLKWMEKI